MEIPNVPRVSVASETGHKENTCMPKEQISFYMIAFLQNPFSAVGTHCMGAKSRRGKSEEYINNAACSQGPQSKWIQRDAKPRGSKGEVAPIGTVML